MTNSWETLFHLSNFMKYLIVEVLPKEHYPCPQKLLDGLFELLNVTQDCIKQTMVVQKLGNQNRGTEKEGLNVLKTNFRSGELNSNINEPSCYTTVNVKNKSAMDLSDRIYKSIIISENFKLLNVELLSARLSGGYFCIPCDSIFNLSEDWASHINCNTHLNKTSKSSCVIYKCINCDLIILGQFAIVEIYLELHSEGHEDSSTSDKCVSEIEKNNITGVCYPQNHHDLSDKNDQGFPQKFILINEEVIRSKVPVGYCRFCDQSFKIPINWQKHLKKCHSDLLAADLDCLKNCEMCSFAVLGSVKASEMMISFHLSSHDRDEKLNSSDYNNTSMLENLSFSEPDSRDAKGYKREKAINGCSSSSSRSDIHQVDSKTCNWADESEYTCNRNRFSDQKYIFTKRFIDIHDRKDVKDRFYCRPCGTFGFCGKELWKHCSEEKHLEFMSSPHFKNFKGICSNCQFTVIGTERTVNEYMKYHGSLHENLLDFKFDFYPVKEGNKNYEKGKKHLFKKKNYIRNKFMENTPVPQEDNDNPICFNKEDGNEPIVAECDKSCQNILNNQEKSDESILDQLKQIYKERSKGTTHKTNLSFMGFCLSCGKVFNSGFDWMDHISSSEHRSKSASSFEEITFSELNINMFGPKTSLVF